jgi:AraC-like DNA-binding protein
MAADVVGPQEVVFRSPLGCIGRFRISPAHPSFHDTGPIERHLVAFPRVAVVITRAGEAPSVADPTRAMIYNRGQQYRRDALGPHGDRCEWFSFDARVIADAARPWDPDAAQRPERPFARTWGPVDAATYALQRRVYELVAPGAAADRVPDALQVEEGMLAVLRRLLCSTHSLPRVPGARASTRRGHAETVERARILLAARFREAMSLLDIARTVGSSPFHLARVFRAHARVPLHAYRTQLRLRASLEALAGGPVDLAALALDLGFSSHSHFTTAFRRAFGVVPSRWQSSKNLKAGVLRPS